MGVGLVSARCSASSLLCIVGVWAVLLGGRAAAVAGRRAGGERAGGRTAAMQFQNKNHAMMRGIITS